MLIQSKEKENNVIDLPEDDPAIIRLLIQYLYEGDYDPKPPTRSEEEILKEYIISIKESFGPSYDFPHTCSPSLTRQVLPNLAIPTSHHVFCFLEKQ